MLLQNLNGENDSATMGYSRRFLPIFVVLFEGGGRLSNLPPIL